MRAPHPFPLPLSTASFAPSPCPRRGEMECASLRDAGIGMATVMITTGGTGGHIFPGLAVASELKSRGASVFWLGTNDGMESRLVPKHGVDFEGIGFSSVRGKGWKRLLFGPYAIANACRQALTIIARKRPGRRRRLRRVRVVSGRTDGCGSQPAARHPQPRRACRTRQSRAEARRGSRAHRVSRRARRRTQPARRMGRQSVARRDRGRRRRPSSASPAAAGRCVCS